MRSTPIARRHTPWALPRTEAMIRTVEAEVLARLSAEEQPLTRVELERMIGASPLDVANALHNLAVAGSIVLSELRVALVGCATSPILATVVPLRRRADAGRAALRMLTVPVRELAAGSAER